MTTILSRKEMEVKQKDSDCNEHPSWRDVSAVDDDRVAISLTAAND
jgi:hypothetical protein